MRFHNVLWTTATTLASSSTRRVAASSSSSSSPVTAVRVAAAIFPRRSMTSSTTSSNNNKTKSDYYTVGITGSSGLVGTALIDELQQRTSPLRVAEGKPLRIVKLIRGTTADHQQELPSTTTKITSLTWNPDGDTPDSILNAEELDAIVHLAGENVGTGLGPFGFLGIRPWSQQKKDLIVESRVKTTKALSQVVAQSDATQTLLVASGVGVYGDDFIGTNCPAADESMDTSHKAGFLAHVSREWEAATFAAQQAANDTRVVNMRFGVALSKKGGALQKLWPVFFMGGGGIIGSGQQYFSFISARDLARGIVHCLETSSLEGPVNLCAPQPCTNQEFTAALGKVLHRPTFLPFPAFACRLVFGEMGDEMLLGGVRAVPTKLQESGFEFQHPTIEEALSSAMNEDI